MAATPQAEQEERERLRAFGLRSRAEFRIDSALHHLRKIPFDSLSNEEIIHVLDLEAELRDLAETLESAED